jgi:hypothetical protein
VETIEEAELRKASEVDDGARIPGVVVVGEDPADVGPPKAAFGGVDVMVVIRVAVVATVMGSPPQDAFLAGSFGEKGEQELCGAAQTVAAVTEVAMVAGCDGEHAKGIRSESEPEQLPREGGEEGCNDG